MKKVLIINGPNINMLEIRGFGTDGYLFALEKTKSLI
jgi:3-dehydroquinate dehydratase